MKKLRYLTIIFSFFYYSVYAQEPAPGKVMLSNGKIVMGEVDINSFTNSAIVTLDDGRQLTYHASMIQEIVTKDACEQERIYRCLTYRSNIFFDRREKKLFQVLNDGNITLLRRVFEYDVFDASDEYEIEEWYYYTESKVHRIKNFKRQVLPLMEDYEKDMKTFRERNKIRNLNKEVNMYLMVSFYNRISELNAMMYDK